MSPLSITPQAQLDYQLLESHLNENLYSDPELLYDTDIDDLLECFFQEYYTFLYGSFPLIDWYKQFRRDAYRLLQLRGQSEDETEYRLRSSRFVQFAQRTLANTTNEPRVHLTPRTDASTSGEELHVSA